jgi:hypothetical protein
MSNIKRRSWWPASYLLYAPFLSTTRLLPWHTDTSPLRGNETALSKRGRIVGVEGFKSTPKFVNFATTTACHAATVRVTPRQVRSPWYRSEPPISLSRMPRISPFCLRTDTGSRVPQKPCRPDPRPRWRLRSTHARVTGLSAPAPHAADSRLTLFRTNMRSRNRLRHSVPFGAVKSYTTAPLSTVSTDSTSSRWA